MDAAAELGRNRVSKHPIHPEYGDEQADAGRDGRARLARPNSQARMQTGKYYVFPVSLTTSRIGNLTRLINTLAICVTIHRGRRINRGKVANPPRAQQNRENEYFPVSVRA